MNILDAIMIARKEHEITRLERERDAAINTYQRETGETLSIEGKVLLSAYAKRACKWGPAHQLLAEICDYTTTAEMLRQEVGRLRNG